jgi:hypothetical protein
MCIGKILVPSRAATTHAMDVVCVDFSTIFLSIELAHVLDPEWGLDDKLPMWRPKQPILGIPLALMNPRKKIEDELGYFLAYSIW